MIKVLLVARCLHELTGFALGAWDSNSTSKLDETCAEHDVDVRLAQ